LIAWLAAAHTAVMPSFASPVEIVANPALLSSVFSSVRDLTLETTSTQSHPDAGFKNAIARTRKTNENSTAVFILRLVVMLLLTG